MELDCDLELLAAHVHAGRLRVLHHHRAVAGDVDRDRVTAVALVDNRTGDTVTVAPHTVLDATAEGDSSRSPAASTCSGAESTADTGSRTREPALRYPGPAGRHLVCRG